MLSVIDKGPTPALASRSEGSSAMPAASADEGVLDGAEARPAGAEDKISYLIRSGADETGQSHDLAAPYVDGYAIGDHPRQVLNANLDGLVREVTPLVLKQLDAAADDEFDEIIRARLLRFERSRDAAVAEHCGAIGDLHHLVDVMRNEDDARSRTDDIAHERKELIDARARQEGGRLVKDEDAGIVTILAGGNILEGAHDRDQGALDLGQVADAGIGIDQEAEAPEGFARLGTLGAPIDVPADLRRKLPDPQVFEDRQRWYQG
jgi:hypothetical protein